VAWPSRHRLENYPTPTSAFSTTTPTPPGGWDPETPQVPSRYYNTNPLERSARAPTLDAALETGVSSHRS